MLPFVCRLLLFTIVAVLCAPACSYAFYDPAAFATPTLEGGGGGRFFTGSPADGQTCETCHTGGKPPSLGVTGLPARYVPGATYELLVSWPQDLGDVGATLELTDAHGRGAGSLALPPPAEVTDDELCEPRNLHILGTSLFDAGEGRSVAGSGGCGASAMRVQWTAPKAKIGLVWLAGAVVVSNQQGDIEGDGVTTFVTSVPPFGQQAASSHDGCSVLPGAGASTFTPRLWAFVLGLLFMRRRRGHQSRLWACAAACVLAACAHDSSLDPGPPQSKGPVKLHSGGAVDAWDVGKPPLDSGPANELPADAGVDAEADGQAPALPPFRLRLTTLPQGGQFAPKNVGAVWVEDQNGKWVKTLTLWAGISLRYLSHYLKVNSNGNTVDAITSATLTAHQEHVINWNLSDAKGGTVPDGTYHVRVQVTDRNGPGQLLDLAFVKGAAAQEIAPSDTPYFTDVELLYEPPSETITTGDR